MERQANVLARIDYLSGAELRYVAEALRRNEQSFTAYAESPHVATLKAKGFVHTPGGVYEMDFPFVFLDFAWKALLARKPELLAKDDENERKQKEEEAARARRSRY